MSNLTLWELGDQLREFERIADSDDIPEEVIRDTLEALQGSFEQKAVAVGKFVLSLQANAAAVKAIATAQAERAKRIEKRAESLKAYMLFVLQAAQVKRVETAELTIRRQNNPAALVISDQFSVPEEFWVQPPPPPREIDKQALKEALKQGRTVMGAYLDQGEHVRIGV